MWIHFGEEAFYEKYTTSYAFESMGATIINVSEMGSCMTREASLVTFHGAHPKIYKVTTHQLRTRFPNAKLVSLGSDSIPYLYGFGNQGMLTYKDFEFCTPENVDLHLDLLDEVVNKYRQKGINADSWMWTISQKYLDELDEKFLSLPLEQKTIDCYSLIVVKTPYRQQLKKYLETECGLNSIIGPNEPDLEKVLCGVWRSKIAVGTTSGGWTPQRTMKGFRDWICPALGTVLIYDNHPDVVRKYGPSVWHYQYDDITEIPILLDTITMTTDACGLPVFNQMRYDHMLLAQRQWIAENTIEKQFQRIFKKHGLLLNSGQKETQ